MEFTAIEIAELLGGRVEGNSDTKVSKLSKIEEGEPNSLSFLGNEKYTPYIYDTKASIVIVNQSFKPEKTLDPTLIYVEDAHAAFGKILSHYNQIENNVNGIEEYSKIDDSAVIGNNVYVGSFAYVGKNVKLGNNVKIYPHSFIGNNVEIGDNSIVFSGVKIYSNCKIGKNCIIHSNSVIGSDGFGYAPSAANGHLEKVPQIGNVILENHVEIGASCTIDRATLGSTIIKEGVKLDNQIQIAHNVVIGENTVIASQSGVAGSTKIGKNNMIGGQVGIVGHLKVGDNVMVQAQSGVNSNVKDNEQLYGSPAIQYNQYRKSYVLFRKFPELVKRIEQLEKLIKNRD